MKLFLPILIVLFFTAPSYADNAMQLPVKNDVHYLKVDIDRDGIEEEISTILASPAWKANMPYICVVTVKDDGQEVSLAIPVDSSSYNISVVNIAPDYIKPFIGLDCHCGMHGRRLILLKYIDYRNMGANNEPTLEKIAYFLSDRPLIKIKDVDGDKIKEIIAEDRDYEINPIGESFISTYKYIDEYIFDPYVLGNGKWKRISVYRTATKEDMPKDWDKDKFDIETYISNMKKFGMYESDAPHVYTKDDNNIYLSDIKDNETQLTFQGRDYEPRLSPNGQQIIFIRHTKENPFTSDAGWFPSDFDGIWSININGDDKRCIVENNYSKTQDMNNYLGSFDSLHFSPDGKKIYFLCQNCTTNAILYSANTDGSNIKRIRYAHQLDIVGGNPDDKHYGYLVAGVKKYPKDTSITRWVTVLMDPEGNEIKEIDSLDKFWQKYKKYE